MSNDTNIIRTMVRGSYDLQSIRIQMGNRITGNFKTKLGLTTDGMSEKALEKQEKKILDMLRADYKRITDGIIDEGEAVIASKLPSPKKFKAGEIISTYTELVLVDQYMKILSDEETAFKQLGKVMAGIPVYDNFLSQVVGCGVQMAAVILSEIDITKAEYSSSLWAYAGLDCHLVGKYSDESGKEFTVPGWQIDEYYQTHDVSEPMIMHGRYEVKFSSMGRSRKEESLVNREYINKNKEPAVRRSITYNPFLKTKLIGVLGSSFLRAGVTTVDGVRMSAAKRLELATKIGFVPDAESDLSAGQQVIEFLRGRSYNVVTEPSEYGKVYYEYKARLNNMPAHKDKTPGHIHAMAVRYAVKRFLVSYYIAARTAAGLPVAEEYAVAKLGLVHKVATEAKSIKPH